MEHGHRTIFPHGVFSSPLALKSLLFLVKYLVQKQIYIFILSMSLNSEELLHFCKLFFKNSVKRRLVLAAPCFRWETEAHLRSSILSEQCSHILDSILNESGFLVECNRKWLVLIEEKKCYWASPRITRKTSEPGSKNGWKERCKWHRPQRPTAASVRLDSRLSWLCMPG